MTEFTEIPTKFPSLTMHNPKMVMMHMDTLKKICQELQDAVNVLNTRIETIEKSVASKKTKE